MQDKPIVIMLTGPASSGKSTFAETLRVKLAFLGVNAVKRAFAGSLKESVSNLERFFGIEGKDPTKTNWDNYEQKAKARPLLVEVGRFLRAKDSDVFVEYLWSHYLHGAEGLGIQVLIIEDWRYLNEYNYLAQRCRAIIPVKLNRACALPANDEERTSLAEIDEALPHLPTHLSVPEWSDSVGCGASAGSLANFVEGIVRPKTAITPNPLD